MRDSESRELPLTPMGRLEWDSVSRLSEHSPPQLSLSHRQKGHPSFFYTPNILLSRSDPVTPGLVSGLGLLTLERFHRAAEVLQQHDTYACRFILSLSLLLKVLVPVFKALS